MTERTAEELAFDLELRKKIIRDQIIEPGMDSYRWTMPVPEKVWSSNERIHWRVRGPRVKAWRRMSQLQVQSLVHWMSMDMDGDTTRKAELAWPLEGRWDVELTLPFTRRGRRDMSNYVATVVKAVVDGLVDAGVWPDDDGNHVRIIEPGWKIEKPQSTVDIQIERIDSSN